MSVPTTPCMSQLSTFAPYSFEIGYPDSKPLNAFDHSVSQLDQEAFPSTQFSKVDDILTKALFGSKKKNKNTRLFVRSSSVLEHGAAHPVLPTSELRKIGKLHQGIVDIPIFQDREAQLSHLTSTLLKLYPTVFLQDDQAVIEQYGTICIAFSFPV
jgi:hypothetical protein